MKPAKQTSKSQGLGFIFGKKCCPPGVLDPAARTLGKSLWTDSVTNAPGQEFSTIISKNSAPAWLKIIVSGRASRSRT